MSTKQTDSGRLLRAGTILTNCATNARAGVTVGLLLLSTVALGNVSAAQSAAYPVRLVPDVGMSGAEVRVMTLDPTLVYGVDWRITGALATLNGISASWMISGPGSIPEPVLYTLTPGAATGNALGAFGPFSWKLGGEITPPFYFMDATEGRVTTIGKATTLSNGNKSVIYWDLNGGDPSSGNSSFVPRLGLASPGAIPFLIMSPPVAEPYRTIGDGELVVDLSCPYVVLVGSRVGSLGDSQVAQALPNLPGLEVHAQWGFIDPGTNRVVVSNGLRFRL